ncbi:MAG: hypothetical protein K2O34_08375 [Acetatifactor sp.]|nr:hypothetical protein [Acetatifactor sp.]
MERGQKHPIKKSVIYTVICIGVLCFMVLCAWRGAKEESPGSITDKAVLDAVIGDFREVRPMDASDPDIVTSADMKYVSAIGKMLFDEKSKRKQEEMAERIMLSMGEERCQSPEWSEGCYLSTVVIPYYDVQENEVAREYHIVMLSKDLQEKMILQMVKRGFRCEISTVMSMDSYMEEPLEEHPEEKFLFLFNVKGLALSSDNQVYACNPKEYQVIGDYYHALDYENLAVSYEDITDPEHLVWVDFTQITE